MFDTIVWATDGSELADRALPLAAELAQVHQSKVVAVHANGLLYGRFGCAPVLADEDDIRTKIEGQVMDLRAEGIDADVKFINGAQDGMAELIAGAAEEVDADLIVIGTHGRGAAATMFLGSVAKRLLHFAPCPVLAMTPARERMPVA